MAQVIVYENGKAIGGEGHPTYARDITFENAGTDLEAEQTNDAIVEVNEKKTDKSTVLWENPSPTASFSAQNISLNSSDYDVLDWYYYANNASKCISVSSLKGMSTMLHLSAGNDVYSRSVEYNSATSFTVNAGYNVNTANNNVCVPIKVIGRKL